MRATRAYIAGIGTSGVLLVFAALLLIVLGALLGFRGWPGGSTAQRVDTLVIEEPDRPLSIARTAAADDRGADRVRSLRRPADAEGGTAGPAVSDRVLSTGSGRPLPGSTRATAEDRLAGGGGAGGGPIGPAAGAPSTAPVSAPPAPPPSAPKASPPRPTNRRPGISPLTDGLGGTTEGLTDELSVQVRPLSPPLSDLLRDGGGGLGVGIVDLGHLIDGTVPLAVQARLGLPPPPPR